MMRRGAFLDRDGVINRRAPEHDYVRTPADLELLPRAVDAIRLLHDGGFVCVVVSNQRGVARGLVSTATLTEIERRICAAGAPIERFYYCPHDLDDRCSCRKPQPGLLLRAADELGLSLVDSVMIGDSESDVAAGAAVGCKTIRLAEETVDTTADQRVHDLWSAAVLLVEGTAAQASTAEV
jgi:D-glycero-D-manno-heptose 1,7-bisphosphate phosphatase